LSAHAHYLHLKYQLKLKEYFMELDHYQPSRRRFVQTAGLASLGLITGGIVSPANWLGHSGKARNVVTRKNIADLDVNDPSFRILKDAVGVLKKRSLRSPLDPLGWQAHASNHASFCATNEYRNQVHYNWFLLPWHRGYIYSLEKKLQEAVREPHLALHYWDWTKYPRIPMHYWGADNPMNNTSRFVVPEDEIPYDFINIGASLRTNDFYIFGGYPKVPSPQEQQRDGIAEQTYHNNIHNWIGGDMASFANSGNDMVFTGHHGNLDRIWEAWLAYDKANKNPINPDWLETTFYFTDAKGKPLDLKVKDLLNTEDLGYRFDNVDFNPVFCNPFSDEGCPSADGERAQANISIQLTDSQRQIFSHSGKKWHRAYLQFERMELPYMPYCARLFFGFTDGNMLGAGNIDKYISTFTVLPIGKPYAGTLQKDVYVEIELNEMVASHLANQKSFQIKLFPVPLRGRTIPQVEIQLKTASLNLHT
jgi:hypothetical protein